MQSWYTRESRHGKRSHRSEMTLNEMFNVSGAICKTVTIHITIVCDNLIMGKHLVPCLTNSRCPVCQFTIPQRKEERKKKKRKRRKEV